MANSIENVTVFAGTVFGEVLVWVPHLETEKCIVQRFQAHSVSKTDSLVTLKDLFPDNNKLVILGCNIFNRS